MTDLKKVMPIIILLVSALTHFIFYGRPAEVVFDEVHIGDYVTNYWHGTYFFDVHPPLAKLIIAGFGYMIGAAKDAVDWTSIGNPLTPATIALRLIPMIAGALLPVIIYWICRRLNISKIASLTAGILVTMENSLIVESRFMIVDMVMIFFGFLSLATYLEFRHQANSHKQKNIFLAVSLLSAAACIGVKWTGLAFPLLIVMCHFYSLHEENRGQIKTALKRTFLLGCKYAAVIIVFYIGLFAIHFAVLPSSGYGNAYMSPYFQKTLLNNQYSEDDSIKPEGFVAKFLELNVQMYGRTSSLTMPHQYSSKWYTWPIMLRPIFYWESSTNTDSPASANSYIYLLGNPLIYWLGTSTVLTLFILWLVRITNRRRLGSLYASHANNPALFFILVGYAVNFLPFIFIGRVMFLYHYEAALIMNIMSIAYLLDTIPAANKQAAVTVLVCLAAATFIFFAPLTYALPLTDKGLAARMWLSSWR